MKNFKVDNQQLAFINSNEPEPNPFQQYQGGRRVQQDNNQGFDGKRKRQAIIRKPIDYNHSLIREIEDKIYQKTNTLHYYCPPHLVYQQNIYPSSGLITNPSWDIMTHFAHASTNKNRCPINCVVWTPEGRRLITGAASGEFTLWNGMAFNFETIQQAHDHPIRAMMWSHNDEFLVTSDGHGVIKYWQPNMNNLKGFQGHDECIRDLTFSPTDTKFASCSDDSFIKIWDFKSAKNDSILRGHGSDVKCCDWHPFNSIIASGSKDNYVKLWDAKSNKNVATLYGHKSAIYKLKWNKNGNWLLSCGRDQLIKLFDIRFMKEYETYRGHKKEVTSISWHPFHEKLFCSGGHDGDIMYWTVGNDEHQGIIPNAHDGAVWDLKFHPLGHVLCSGSGDFTTKFWSRNKPGDQMKDKYNHTQIVGNIEDKFKVEKDLESMFSSSNSSNYSLPGINKRPRSPSLHGNYDSKKHKQDSLPGIKKY